MRAGHRMVRPRLRLEPGHRHLRPRTRRPGHRPARPRRKRLPAFARLKRAGLAGGASAYVRTPAGGIHAYFTGSGQCNRRLPGHHLDFRSQGGYVLAPPSQVGAKSYQLVKRLGGHSSLDWAAVTRLLEPQRQQQQPKQRSTPKPRPQPSSPMGREPARRQPQRRPVLGRRPRARRRPRRRPQPPGYRRPQGRPRGAGDHADSRLRAQDKPGPQQMLCASSGTSHSSAAGHRG